PWFPHEPPSLMYSRWNLPVPPATTPPPPLIGQRTPNEPGRPPVALLRAGGASGRCTGPHAHGYEQSRGAPRSRRCAWALRQLVVHPRRVDRLVAPAAKPDGNVDGRGRVRRPDRQPQRGQLLGPVHAG